MIKTKKSNGMNGVVGHSSSSVKNDFYHLLLTFFISLTAIPLMYLLNYTFGLLDDSVRTFWMMMAGFSVLTGIPYITYKFSRINDWMYFGFTAFTFTAVIDAVIPLDFIGSFDGLMTEYLKLGEPYLLSPWGSAACVFDGIGFLIMYLVLVYLFTNNKSYRSMGLYWGASILNSMIVLLSGVFCGRHSATLCTFLNIPYVLFPVAVLFRLFQTQKRSGWTNAIKSSLFLKLYDLMLIFGTIASICIVLAKTFTVLGSVKPIFKQIAEFDGALLLSDPAPFYSIQALIFFFYGMPIQIITLYYLFRSEKPQFLWEAVVVQAGAMLQAQFSHIWESLDKTTPQEFRAEWTDSRFWIANLVILIVPHLLLARLYFHRQNHQIKKLN